MGRITFLFFFIFSFYNVWCQPAEKIKYTIANGLKIEGVDESNPVIYDNDMVLDSPEDEFLWLKAHNGKVKLVGNIITRDMIGCVFPVGQTCNLTLEETINGWKSTWEVAQAAGLKNIPKPIAGAGEVLVRPASGRIEDTRFKSSPGADLIIAEAHKASAAKPLVIFAGANVSTVANAYLKDPSIASKILVLQVHGYHNSPIRTVSYNTTDPWATYVVMKKIRYINWAGDSRSWYWTPLKNVNLTQAMVNTLPNNPLANGVKTWYQRFFGRESLADAPVVLYFFNHSLWRSVERRMENGQITTSDSYDYLMVSGNNWTSYGPDLINYMKDPNNYLANPQPAPNLPPTIKLVGPAHNSQHAAGASIIISATATDSDGSVSKVEFYNGTTKLGEDTTTPFSYEWKNAGVGNFIITAKATDNKGGVTTSSAVTVVVQNPNTAPQINITNPSNNSSVNQGSPVSISAVASDADGSVTKVEFFNGNVKLGQDDSSPYSFNWSNASVGRHTITAKAFDDQGRSTISSPINVTIQALNTAPQITITSPTHNEAVEHGNIISITANASDANGSIAKVEFYVGSIKLGEDNSGPFTFTWNEATAGNHAITAKAFDDRGMSATSSAVTLTIHPPNTAPKISITAPAHNSSADYGSPVTMTATASDETGSITKVEFYTGSTKLGEDTNSPFTLIWNNAAAGNHTITAKAFDDKGLSAASSSVTLTIRPANTAPQVTITSPAHNASIPQGNPVTIAANASDALGSISKVEFYAGANKLGEDSTSPFTFVWNSATLGDHAITAKAIDDKGLSTIASPVSISVYRPNTAPVVAITTPTPTTSLVAGADVTIAATASDATGTVTKVEFYAGTYKLGTDQSAPFSFIWNNILAGNYTLTAKAFDDKGMSSTSAPVIITVKKANTGPAVEITSPVHNSSVAHKTPIVIHATASDADGTVSKVEFYSGSTKLATDSTSPFTFTWNNPLPGIYSLTAKAFDNHGVAKTSEVTTVTVASSPIVIHTRITNLIDNTTFNHGTPITMAAQATVSQGKIAKVEFFNHGTKLGEDLTSPYDFTWNSASVGKHSLTAKATTDQQATHLSEAVVIEVKTPVQVALVAPSIRIVEPQSNASFPIGSTVQIQAEASEASGISKVEFYNNNIRLGEATSKPYLLKTELSSPGAQRIQVKAFNGETIVATHEIQLNAIDHPTADAGEKITITLPQSSVTLTGDGKASDGSSVSHAWSQVNGPDDVLLPDFNTHEIVVDNLIEGTYTFEYTVTDTRGLVAKDQVQIEVVAAVAYPEVPLPSIPRFFSPNDDGINDVWELPEHELFENAIVTIFNSAGQKIYESLSHQTAWDGKLEGKPLQEDAYYYIIRMSDSNDIKGAIRIIR